MTVPYDIMNDVLAVLTRISNGKVPTVACDEQGLAYSTFVTYTTRYPDLGRMRVEAEDRLYDQMAEALPLIFDHPIYGQDDPKAAGVVSSNIKWLLERRRTRRELQLVSTMRAAGLDNPNLYPQGSACFATRTGRCAIPLVVRHAS